MEMKDEGNTRQLHVCVIVNLSKRNFNFLKLLSMISAYLLLDYLNVY